MTSPRDTEKRVKDMIQIRNKVLETNKTNISKAQTTQKRYYDQKHGATKEIFKVGDRVLMRNMRNLNRIGGKLEPKFLGPYMVCDSIGKG